MALLTPQQIAQLDEVRSKLRADKGLPPIAPTRTTRARQVAALFILGASYGQLMTLFNVTKGVIHDAIMRNVPPKLRARRGTARGKLLIKHELASLYMERISEAGWHDNAITLAARLQQLVTNEDPTE